MSFIRFLSTCYIFLHMAFLTADEFTLCSSNNCYKMIEAISEGAFCKVFSVESLEGEKLVLKTYKHMHDKDMHEACPLELDSEREFSIGLTLDHSNIVKVLDHFSTTSSDDGISHHLVLPFVKGVTLRSIPKGDLSYQQAKYILTQLIDALRYGLSRGMLYTDLHEENVLITRDFEVMIIDIGSFYTIEEMHSFFFQAPMSEGETFAYYLEIATTFFNDIITKSNLERTQKFNLCAEFKKIAWNFKEDVYEGKKVSIYYCFDKLLALI